MSATRLLLVDDEDALAELLRRYLEKLGYEVHTCATPEAALERFESDPSAYALVLADLTLPGMKGDAMLARMRSANPKLKAILTSGYPYVSQESWMGFVQKPFLPRALVEEIEKRLDGRGKSG